MQNVTKAIILMVVLVALAIASVVKGQLELANWLFVGVIFVITALVLIVTPIPVRRWILRWSTQTQTS